MPKREEWMDEEMNRGLVKNASMVMGLLSVVSASGGIEGKCSLPCCWSYVRTASGCNEFNRIAAQKLIQLRGFSQVHPLRSCFNSPGHHIPITINYRGYGYRGKEKA
ncbi:uncharacterized [Tachysurus ichikawai]